MAMIKQVEKRIILVSKNPTIKKLTDIPRHKRNSKITC